MFIFDTPLAFLLLLLIPVPVFFHLRKNQQAGIRFSSTRHAKKMKPSLRQQLAILPLVLRIGALILFTIALARPQEGKELIRDMSRGIAIEMVVDRSSSMSVLKDFGSKSLNRLDIVKTAFSEFVGGGNSGLEGRPQDLIGMITFARYADTVCPLTLSHGALLQFIESTKTVEPGSPEDGTSIGDGVALAAARLKTAEATLADQLKDKNTNYEIKSKVIILLTDGGDTGIGKRPPMEAAKIAKEWGIKIYTIGLSGDDWYVIVDDPFFGKQKRPAQTRVDTNLLTDIAETTGGFFRMATDINSLRDIYKEIDSLEKSEIESFRYLDYKELFVLFALLGLLLLAGEFVLSHTVFRRIP
ncbi:MAG: VWA domain-containing protein [Spirochaetales bacterium]|nr:VWA domain-containing protein [Spirochaetales bacterium]